jgi:hypothetical protein
MHVDRHEKAADACREDVERWDGAAKACLPSAPSAGSVAA